MVGPHLAGLQRRDLLRGGSVSERPPDDVPDCPDGCKTPVQLALTSCLQRGSYVFPGRKEGEHLSKTAMRDRLRHLCEGAGWPGLSRSQLTAAFVLWLREHGLDDHSIRLNLGRRRAATIDRLTRSHESIAAQLSVDVAYKGLEL